MMAHESVLFVSTIVYIYIYKTFYFYILDTTKKKLKFLVIGESY